MSSPPTDSLLIYGLAVDSSLDSDGQRSDPAWLAEAMPEWFAYSGTIREQFMATRPVGIAIGCERFDDRHCVGARIFDVDAIAKIKAGVLTGFGIGIKNPLISNDGAPGGTIIGGKIVTVSLVGKPSHPSWTFRIMEDARGGVG